MMLIFLSILKSAFGIKIPVVFAHFSTRMMLAALTSLLLSLFLGPTFIRKLYELKIGQSIRKEECPLLGKLHEKKQNTPTMGGILILFSMIVSLLLWMDLKSIFTLLLLATTLVLGAMGGWDDYLKLKFRNVKGLSARKKLAVQVLFSCVIASYLLFPVVTESVSHGKWFHPPVIKESVSSQIKEQVSLKEFASRLYIPFFKEPLFTASGVSLLFLFFFYCFVITGASNAVNLTDGLDGLAAGALILVAGVLAIFAFISNNIDLSSYLNIPYIEGSGEIAIYLSAMIGACLGFLWYNGYPAQVFMGDIGSLTLGGIIGVSAILLKREFLFAIVGGLFVAEAASVVLQVASYRLRGGKRIFLCAPLHHHFEYKGWPETKVVIRFWIIGLFLAIIGLATLKFQ